MTMNFYEWFNLYGPFVVTLILAISVTVVVIGRHKRRQALAKSRRIPVRRSSRPVVHPEERPVPAAGPRPEPKEAAPRPHPARALHGMTTCPKCKMKVFPLPDGVCPSCQAKITK